VILGLDDAVGGAALARDVTVFQTSKSARNSSFECAKALSLGYPYRSTISPRSFSILAV
jgi:hypothetical protein